MKRDITATTISEYLAAIDAFAPQQNMNYFNFWFRGERDHRNWRLVPKVFRKGIKDIDAHLNYERDITNRFRVLAHSRHNVDLVYENYGRSLSLMQHHGLPTRLLDWSTSSLIALFFAVGKYNYDKSLEPIDAGVWILNPYDLNGKQFNDPTTPSIEGGSVRKYLRPAFNGWLPAGADVSKKDVSKKGDYFNPGDKCFKAVMGVEFDARIFVQQGAFTIHTTDDCLAQQEQFSSCLGKVIIPSECVRNIGRELMLAGFRNSTIYPDLGHLSDDLNLRHSNESPD